MDNKIHPSIMLMTGIAEMYGFESKKKYLNDNGELKKWFSERLIAEKIPSAFCWYLCKEPEEEKESNDPLDLEVVIKSKAFEESSDKKSYIEKHLQDKLSEKVILKIAKRTYLQYNNVEFCRLKSCRLSASNFGVTLAAIGRNSFPDSLFDRLRGHKKDDKV